MPRLFGAKLRYVRESSHLTQGQLAERLGILQSHISHLEAGRKNPLINFVLGVAHMFLITTDYLLYDSIAVEALNGNLQPAPLTPLIYPSLIGQKVRYLRTQRQLQQGELAEVLQLRTQAFISLLETGQKQPSTLLLIRMAEFFDVTTDYLLHDEIAVDVTP
ncbi:MAG: helix-turn-helix domain-containing protein [Herpetosiphonaceae bacterium]|nr:helix-turn-helix domain-containing protein [Herpetosiphonaceae bacterium]